MISRLAFAAAILASLVLLPGTATAADERSALRQALMEADRAFARDTAEEGSGAWADWFADDGLIVTSEGPLAEGREAVRRLVSGFLDDPNLIFTWEPERAEVAAAGDMGWTVGRYRAERKGPEGEPQVRTGRYLTVWTRQPDGGWKVALDIDVRGGG